MKTEWPVTRRSVLAAAGGSVAAGAFPLAAVAAGKRKWRIGLSNSFIGNKWRLEMENLFKAALRMEPYKSQVQGTWYNSGNNVSAQTQQITDMIGERLDAILVDAASPTGLDGILGEAASRGVLVAAFDNLVTSKKVVEVITDQFAVGKRQAEFLVKKLGGHGNVIMVTGVAGTYYDTQMNLGADSVWKMHPGIKVVSRYEGKWDPSTAEQATSAMLPSLPKIDGIWSQGGTDGVLKAFIAARRTPLPPTAGGNSNGFRKFMRPAGYMGQTVDGLSVGQPPYLSIVALKMARQILDGKRKRQDITLPLHYLTDNEIKEGINVFPKLPDSFFANFTDSGPDATVSICVDAALRGEPCPGRLAVNLPD